MGKFSAFMLPLKGLSIGTHEFGYHLGKQFFADMESQDVRDADLNVAVTVKYDGELYTMDFAITGELTLICDRCLDELHWPIEASYKITVKYGDDYNDDSDEVLEIPVGDASLNVSYMIYDTVALAIPIKHVHPAGKCNRAMSAILKKHRARPGDEDADLENELLDEMDDLADSEPNEPATDPRWDALRKLSDGDDNE